MRYMHRKLWQPLRAAIHLLRRPLWAKQAQPGNNQLKMDCRVAFGSSQ
jgi:ribosomal protein L11 methylase PrmA